MKAKIKLFLPLVLICSLLVGSSCFASSSGRGSAYIFGDNSLNSEVIRQFNSMSNQEQSDLVRSISPLLFNRLGFIMNDPYTTINTYWQLQKTRRVNEFTSAENYLQNTTDEYPYTFVYLYEGVYYWYDELVDYLRNTMTTLGGQLVMNDTSGINYILNSYVATYADTMGVRKVTVYSYKNINSSNFGNITLYNNFISGLDALSNDYDYVALARYDSTYFMYLWKGDFVFKDSTSSYIIPIDNNGSIYTYKNVTWRQLNNTFQTYTPNQSYISYTITNNKTSLGSPTVPNTNGSNPNIWSFASGGNGVGGWNCPQQVYSLKGDKFSKEVFVTVNAWINAHGHFEYPFQTTNYFGRVPSVTVNSNDMTNIYNQIFTDNSNNSVNTNSTTNVYYPNSFEPGSNSYDEDTHKLDFSGVGALLASLGNLIGSLINGFAQGFANIIESITSVARNIMEALAGGTIFEFLKSFMAWLPEPLPSLIFGLFTISVTFAVIRLVKGALS